MRGGDLSQHTTRSGKAFDFKSDVLKTGESSRESRILYRASRSSSAENAAPAGTGQRTLKSRGEGKAQGREKSRSSMGYTNDLQEAKAKERGCKLKMIALRSLDTSGEGDLDGKGE